MITPSGYQVLIKPAVAAEKTPGGVIMPDQAREKDSISAVVAEVIGIGQDAYRDELKFPTGPWVEVGDWVIIGKHVGSRYKYKGEEYRLLDDDKILAVVDDPEQVSRVM